MSEPKTLLFDMDGTIIDTDLLIIAIWEEIFSEFDPGRKPHLKELLSYSGPPLKESFAKALPNVPIATLQSFYSSHVDKYYSTSVVPFEGERDVLEELKNAGYKLGVVTNKARPSSFLALDKTGLDGLFDVLVCGDEVHAQKPSPEGILRALSEFGIEDPKEAIYIGDTDFDRRTALNAGTPFLHARFSIRESLPGVKPEDELRSYGDLRKRLLG